LLDVGSASKAVPGHFDQELAVYGVFGVVTLLKCESLAGPAKCENES
jgi:hypothetical protein